MIITVPVNVTIINVTLASHIFHQAKLVHNVIRSVQNVIKTELESVMTARVVHLVMDCTQNMSVVPVLHHPIARHVLQTPIHVTRATKAGILIMAFV